MPEYTVVGIWVASRPVVLVVATGSPKVAPVPVVGSPGKPWVVRTDATDTEHAATLAVEALRRHGGGVAPGAALPQRVVMVGHEFWTAPPAPGDPPRPDPHTASPTQLVPVTYQDVFNDYVADPAPGESLQVALYRKAVANVQMWLLAKGWTLLRPTGTPAPQADEEFDRALAASSAGKPALPPGEGPPAAVIERAQERIAAQLRAHFAAERAREQATRGEFTEFDTDEATFDLIMERGVPAELAAERPPAGGPPPAPSADPTP